MSLSIKPFQGDASDFKAEIQFSSGYERESNILPVITKAIEEIVSAVGGYVSVSASGHLNYYDDQPGDGLNIQVNSFMRPSPPVKDSGLESAGGSARNFPPEASTAAPQTEDNSPAATQEPNPQPAQVVPSAESAQNESVEATVSVDVPTDEHGDGEQAVEGPPSSIKDVTATGFGPLGTVTEEPVAGHPDETEVVVKDGAPSGEEVEITQTEPSVSQGTANPAGSPSLTITKPAPRTTADPTPPAESAGPTETEGTSVAPPQTT